MAQKVYWKMVGVLWLAGMLGGAAVVPFTLTLARAKLEKLPLSLSALVALQLVQVGALVAIAVSLGLWLAGKVGTRLPLVEAWLGGRPTEVARVWFGQSALVGIVVALVIIGLDLAAFAQVMPADFPQPPLWQHLLASFYGGIDEEILLRLFLLTLLAWLLGKLWHDPAGRPTTGAFWVANVATAVAFGLGHLPVIAAVMPLTTLVVVRAVVLNGIAGVSFGLLYWKWGLEFAMLAHFTADIVLAVVSRAVT